MIALYHQTKTPINFWRKWRLNSRSLIQSSEILPIELPETHVKEAYLIPPIFIKFILQLRDVIYIYMYKSYKYYV